MLFPGRARVHTFGVVHIGAVRGVRCPLLVGRADEVGLLSELVTGATHGRGGLAFVLGEPGIGKSRLLAAMADIARSRDMAVLRGRAAPSPIPVPYRPLAEAFLSALRGRNPEGDGLAPFQEALPVLVPGWGAIGAQPHPSVMLLGEATLALAQRCAGPSGVLVLLEDLHWADVETCELIDYLSDKVDGTSVALLASVRTGEASNGERLAHTLAARRHATSILLRRLDDDDVEALMGASLGTNDIPAPLREAVAQASGGVPLLVEEFLASLIDAKVLRREGDGWRATEHLPAVVPPSFAVVVADRLASLSEAARRVLTAAAVIDDRIDSRLVALATGLDEAATIEGLREAVRCQLVDEIHTGASTRFRFHHGLGRAAVLETVSEPERRQLAKLALDGLEPDGHEGSIERHHLMGSLALAAGDTPRALRVLMDAAVVATTQGACASARRAAELAAQLATSTDALAEVHEVLLNACVASGDGVRAVEVGRQLLGDLARLSADPIRVAQVHLRLAEVALEATDWASAERHLENAQSLAEPMPADLRAAADLVRASIALGRHRPDEATTAARLAMAAAREIDDGVKLSQAAALLGRALRVSDIDAARHAFAEALDVAHLVGDQALLARAAHELATLDVLDAGPIDRMEEARRLAEAAGALALLAVCDTHLSILHWLHFDLESSRACAQRALDLAVRYQLGLLVPATAVMVAGTHAGLGRREVVEVFDRYLPMMDAEIEATQRGHVLALMALASEDRDAALEQLELAATLAPPYSDVARAPHCGMRALLLALEEVTTASSVTAELDRDPAIVGVARALVDLALAVLQGGRGDGPGALARADRAFTALQATPWFRAMGLRLVAEKAIEHSWGRPVEWLRGAHDFFDAAGIDAPAAASRALLRRAGAPPPRPPATGQHPDLARLGITRRESEILFLVAEGRSNREIAHHLVLSVRTVEKHVERLMVKTSTANRTQLAALANRMARSEALTT